MKVLIVEPNRKPKVAEIENSLAAKQNVVGGFIEMVIPPIHPDDACIICNEEGKFYCKPNRPIRLEDGTVFDIVFGTFFVCRAPEDSEDFESLTEEQIAFYSQLYA